MKTIFNLAGQKNVYLFCIVFGLHYLCSVLFGESENKGATWRLYHTGRAHCRRDVILLVSL